MLPAFRWVILWFEIEKILFPEITGWRIFSCQTLLFSKIWLVFYLALRDNDQRYFMQVFALGIQQVYYVGLIVGKNDIKLLEETKEEREY